MKKVFFAAASLVAFAVAGAANAADLGRPVYKTPAPAPLPPVQDWSGIYVGLEGGYGWGKQNTDAISPGGPFSAVLTSVPPSPPGTTFELTPPLSFPGLAVPSINQKGWLAGGFFGAQKQWGNWVLGIEGDIDGANIKGSGTANGSTASPNTVIFLSTPGGLPPPGTPAVFTCATPCFTLNHNVSLDSKIDALASLRGKVGWSFAPDWLIYGTGGAAFARVENTFISTQSAVLAPPLSLGIPLPCAGLVCTFSSNAGVSQSGSGGTTLFGWAAGGGIDWKLQLDAGSALVFGVEYLHYGFPDQTITLSDNAGGIVAFRAKESVDAVKGRISYLFSIH